MSTSVKGVVEFKSRVTFVGDLISFVEKLKEYQIPIDRQVHLANNTIIVYIDGQVSIVECRDCTPETYDYVLETHLHAELPESKSSLVQ